MFMPRAPDCYATQLIVFLTANAILAGLEKAVSQLQSGHGALRKKGVEMNPAKWIVHRIENYFHKLEVQRVEAYLSQAQNVEDLERRMRAIENRSTFYLP
jgi:polyhydroxyalkanoate synthesis regulator phasin